MVFIAAEHITMAAARQAGTPVPRRGNAGRRM